MADQPTRPRHGTDNLRYSCKISCSSCLSSRQLLVLPEYLQYQKQHELSISFSTLLPYSPSIKILRQFPTRNMLSTRQSLLLWLRLSGPISHPREDLLRVSCIAHSTKEQPSSPSNQDEHLMQPALPRGRTQGVSAWFLDVKMGWGVVDHLCTSLPIRSLFQSYTQFSTFFLYFFSIFCSNKVNISKHKLFELQSLLENLVVVG